MLYFLITFVVVTGMAIMRDWLIYKHRGRTIPDDPNDKNPPVVTGPQDASAQRVIDLLEKEEEK